MFSLLNSESVRGVQGTKSGLFKGCRPQSFLDSFPQLERYMGNGDLLQRSSGFRSDSTQGGGLELGSFMTIAFPLALLSLGFGALSSRERKDATKCKENIELAVR